ncbi:hypothetical protein P3T40_002016 [Paraburkholderia sp. EB58]|uniref:Abi-alpha family protein n=1 Tax=Paraburkholderia sp. EB58 TaxID=3035125 RepID=UPI003D1FB370
MDESSGSGFDPLGAKAFAEASKVVTTGVVKGTGAFLSRICLPVAEEFGLLLQDKVRHWRAVNASNVLAKAEALVEKRPNASNLHVHPRMLGSILEEAAWADQDTMQTSWAGLLATACSEDGADQSNLIFIKLLAQLTPAEAAIITHSCENAKVQFSENGFLTVLEELRINATHLMALTGHADIHRLDLELDHLRELGLLSDGGFGSYIGAPKDAAITPSPLCLQFYARMQGFVGSAPDYYGVSPNASLAVSSPATP